MSSKIRFGLIGVGHLGEMHLKNLLGIESIELQGIHDINRDRLEEMGSRYGVKTYTDMEQLLADSQAVSIVVPTEDHYRVARTALQRGVHCFVEKPFTQTVEEADTLIDLSGKHGNVLQVGHIERYNPALKSLHGIRIDPLFIESHRISPFNVRGTDVAVILDLMIHDIDIILNYVKSDVLNIHASGVPVLTHNIDIANARIMFKNGCVANLTASRIAVKRMRKLRFFQPETYISVDFLNGVTEIFRLCGSDDPVLSGESVIEKYGLNDTPREIRYHKPAIPETNALLNELQDFLGSIHTGKTPRVTGYDGKRALEVALQIQTQIQESLNQYQSGNAGQL